MRAFFRRCALVALVLAAAGVLLLVAWRSALNHFAGGWTHAPEDAPWMLSIRAAALVDAAFEGVQSKAVVDARVAAYSRGQLAGSTFYNNSGHRGDGDNDESPLIWLQSRIREHAAGIRHADRADAEYLSRLLRQARTMPGAYRADLFARDAVYDHSGERDHKRSVDYVTNDYVVWLADQAPDVLSPVVSVHPYRANAPALLERWAKAGVRNISWLPVAQRIDLADARVAECYAVMAEHGMTLRLPVGYRHADNGIEGWIGADALRRALDAGVEVVVTIGGARGRDGQSIMPGLFALLREPDYRERLAVDLAGVLAPGQLDDVLLPLLQHPQFYHRLRYASGYPEPAVAAAIRLGALARRGFIDPALIAPLREIYDVNPLLFVLATLRQVRLPATELRLPAPVFFSGSQP